MSNSKRNVAMPVSKLILFQLALDCSMVCEMNVVRLMIYSPFVCYLYLTVRTKSIMLNPVTSLGENKVI